MNNLVIGGIDPRTGRPHTFYETIGGGMGGRPGKPGLNGVHTHTTNTLNAPVEVLETAYPLRVERYELWEGSGGAGRFPGGWAFAGTSGSWGIGRWWASLGTGGPAPPGAWPGKPGEDLLILDDRETRLPRKGTVEVPAEGVISLRTPGGGGYGPP